MTLTTPRRRPFIDWMFRSRQTGEIVLGQKPNLSALITSVGLLTSVLTRSGGTRRTASVIVVLASVVWGLQELFAGVNPFRRLQGALTLGFVALLARD